jgi:uncharacterized protein YprB with RNaseH-like and TPR domain
MMSDDLGAQLRRLGVFKGTRNLRPAAKAVAGSRNRSLQGQNHATGEHHQSAQGEPQPIAALLPGGYHEENELGACYVIDHVYPISFRHGNHGLGDLRAMSTKSAAIFCNDDRIADMSFDQLLFLDTETTGLMGAGTFAFMVGVAFYDVAGSQPALIVRQYFLRDQADEPAMLLSLAELLQERPGLITFNGRAFDLPILESRYVIQRLEERFGGMVDRPHIDLLPPARRLWRRRIGSCSLGSLEQNILQLDRSQEDVSGWLIPALYMDYLRSGDATELLRVFYHNRIDMLSMVAVAAQILRQFDSPLEEDDALDLLSLARWQSSLGMTAEAESTLLLASSLDMPLEQFHEALHDMGFLLKRSGRREEAAQQWQQIAVTHVQGLTRDRIAITAHVELAKYYEWHRVDLPEAHRWTRRADLVVDDLQHRIERLERKIAQRKSSK